MKLILQIFAFMTILAVIYIVIMNGHEIVSLQLTGSHYDVIANTTTHSEKTFNLGFYTLGILGAGIFSAFCFLAPFYITQTEQLYAYKRELEKTSVKTDSSTSQVKVLQAKIQVLEKALKDALGQ